MAVRMFQDHIFSGSRRTGKPNNFLSGDGRCDFATAQLVKRVLGQVSVSPMSVFRPVDKVATRIDLNAVGLAT